MATMFSAGVSVGVAPDIVGCAVRDSALAAEPAPESQIPPELLLAVFHIHRLWLKGIDNFYADLDQIRKYVGDLAA